MHRIGFYLYPGHQILDFAGPFGAFESVAKIAGRPLYALNPLSQYGGLVRGSGGALVESRNADAMELDTLIVVGGDIAPMRAPGEVAAVRALAGKTARVASVCTGAFLLAEAGLLDGRRAVTHWNRCAEFADRYPRVRLEPDPIFVQDGQIWTSAGITAGIDLALAMVEEDHGHALALAVARELVVFLKRPGGQSQFSAHLALDDPDERFAELHAWIAKNLTRPLTLDVLADQAGMSPRSLSRHYRQRTGHTPAQGVELIRLEQARSLLASGAPVAAVARRCGFGTTETMRRAFLRRIGVGPKEWRDRFRARSDISPG